MDNDKQAFVLDMSVILSGSLKSIRAYELIQLGKFYVPYIIVAKLKDMVNKKIEDGLIGLEELARLRKLGAQLEIVYHDRTPFQSEEFIILDLARKLNAKLLTSDPIMVKLATIFGVDSELLIITGKTESKEGISIRDFFDKDTLSVHLKEGVPPMAKKGVPGNWRLVKIREEPMTREELDQIIRNIIGEARKPGSRNLIEIERSSTTIVQLRDIRVVITKPPFSDAIEITAVRPVKRLKIEEYNLPEKLIERLKVRAEGVLISGPPGHGKTTFAQALAEFYKELGKVVKTIEAPRDMNLSREITSYSKNYGTFEEIRDILLLSRPDYTIFDEMRNPEDFKLFADLRLAGVGMVGVVHATSAMDAIQRFFDKVELGVIPSIIDTVIFMKYGQVARVLALKTTVKVPHGLLSEDLARPVVVIYDFLSGKPMYECYTFGERTFVVPISDEAAKELYGSEVFEPRRKKEERVKGREVPFAVRIRKKAIVFDFGKSMAGKMVSAYIGPRFIFSELVGKSGIVRIDRRSKLGRMIREAIEKGEKITFYEESI